MMYHTDTGFLVVWLALPGVPSVPCVMVLGALCDVLSVPCVTMC